MNQKDLSREKELRAEYFTWLFTNIERRGYDPGYRRLLDILFDTKFFAVIPNDDNRAVDGIKLREKFCREAGYGEDDLNCLDGPCTMFEMMVALALRINYLLSDESNDTAKWFWVMMRNLGLKPYLKNDPQAVHKDIFNNLVIKKLIERTYSETGSGGLFPLEYPDRDQRGVELWYQLQAYLQENYPQ